MAGEQSSISPITERAWRKGLAALLDSWDALDEDFPEIEDPPADEDDGL